jgi:short-subunit dehydrogenase
MRKNKSGYIISITSVGGIMGQPFNDAYCAAKFAVGNSNSQDTFEFPLQSIA